MDGVGIPWVCQYLRGECRLDKSSIKSIKFKDISDNWGLVRVTPEENVNIDLERVGGGMAGIKYIFTNNSSEDVRIQKGSSSVILRANGKTGFIVKNKKLSREERGIYGLPKRCEGKVNCFLWEDDLAFINFSGLVGTEPSTVTIPGNKSRGGWISPNKHIEIKMQEENKYIFRSNYKNTITISRGNGSVTLEPWMEIEFTPHSGSLKKEELGEFGLPKSCDYGEEESKTCVLSNNDLMKVKFKELKENNFIEVPKDQKINLRIQKATEPGYPNNRKYIFTHDAEEDLGSHDYEFVLLFPKQDNFKIFFEAKRESIFKKEGDQLVKVV